MAGQFLAKITGKGQITIPKALREALGFRDGDYVLVFPQGQGMRIEKAAVSPLERFEDLAVRTEERFKRQGVTPRDVEEAVRWARENGE